jgi:ABC-2 type transport system ATP-binding protein
MPIITVRDLRKTFQTKRKQPGLAGSLKAVVRPEFQTVEAIKGITFELEPGELLAFIGPNGAGKSTTLKMLTGLLVPTGGNLKVNGRVPWKERQTHVATLGAVFGQRTTLWWDLPVIESFDLLQYIYQVPPDRFRQNLDEFRQLLDLDPFLDTPVRSLSLGQRMRADLCAALLHDPALLFLDEPTIGLDVVAKERIRQFILHINREHRTTVLLTTHDLSDVEKLCERVMILDHGRLLYDGALDTLQEQFGGKRELLVYFAQEYESVFVDGAQVVEQDGTHATYQFERGDITASELIGRLSSSYRIRDLQVREPEIEETVRRIYEERLLEN